MDIGEFGLRVGSMPKGTLNSICDVSQVRVGHVTLDEGDTHTGVTVVMPCEDNMFCRKLVGASFVLNGFGKTLGLVQLDELGTLETPIAPMYVAETRSMRSSMLPEQTMDQSFPSAPLTTLERPGMLSAQLLPVVSSTPFPLKF